MFIEFYVYKFNRQSVSFESFTLELGPNVAICFSNEKVINYLDIAKQKQT